MIINEEEKNAFTQSVMGDSEGGGSNSIYVDYDVSTGELDASFNELLQYFNEGKLVFSKQTIEGDGTIYGYCILTEIKSGITLEAYFTAFEFYDGASHPYTRIFYSTDPDEKMMFVD